MKDVKVYVSDVNKDETYISPNSLVLEPIFMEYEPIADFMAKVASYGDSSYNSWATGLLASSVAGTPDGKPIIYFEQYPDLLSYEYIVRNEELENEVTLGRMYDEIYNYIIVCRTDENGDKVYYTPETNAGLKSTSSIGYYRQREYLLNLGSIGETAALNYGYRFLNANYNPKWRLSSNIQVKGKIRSATSGLIPVSWVRAGKQIMIENFLQEAYGSHILMLITGTSYSEEDDTVSIAVGSPDPLAVMSAQLKRGII